MRLPLAGYAAAGLVSVLVAGAVHYNGVQSTELLRKDYIERSAAEAHRDAQSVDQAFEMIYQNLRTLASLPGTRSIGRHAETLSPESRASFQMIYNNLANSVSVSEVYITPADFDPERIDPATGKPEEPIIMFDELILNASLGITEDQRAANPDAVKKAHNAGPAEIEIEEYRQLKGHARWFRANYPDNSRIAGLRVPILSGAEIITCDNTHFLASMDDADRKGIIFSVPFFGTDGTFKGLVSAILLSRNLASLLPDDNLALVNPANGYVIAKPDAPPHVAKAMPDITRATPDHDLMFSQVMPLTLPDQRAPWAVWAGFDDNRFYGSQDYRQQTTLRLYGYGLALILFAAGNLVWFFITRNMRNAALAARKLKDASEEARWAEMEARDLAAKFKSLNQDISGLNRDLAEKIRMLEDAQAELVRKGKLAYLGQLMATVAHELRNPLATIRTNSYLVGRKFGSADSGMAPFLARIENGITRCDRILTQLLDYARTRQPDVAPVNDPDAWLIATIATARAQISPEIRLECRTGLKGRTASFDAEQMARALLNLIENAAEATVGKPGMPPPGIAQPQIEVHSALSKRGIEITVSDNGPGIEEETLAKIREPLFTTKNFGTGLGLPAVERIVELHGGGLDVSSRKGHGAVFTLWIPLNPPKLANVA